MSSQHEIQLGSFAFSQQAVPALALGRPSRVGATGLSTSTASNSLSGSVGFTTKGSKLASRTLASRGSILASQRRALPFASLTLASVTAAKPASTSTTTAAAPKKKKSIAEIFEYAGELH